jgi:SAM-dependent methyltransferase
VPPQLARQAISTYSDPGDLVVDLTCSIGTTLVEAIQLGRNAVAVARDHADARRATASLNRARANEAAEKAAILAGDPRELPRLLTQHRQLLTKQDATPSESNVVELGAGHVDLIIMSSAKCDGGPAAVYAACAAALKPGGFLAVVTAAVRASDPRGNLAGETVALCEHAGLLYWQHVIALHAPIRDGTLTRHRLQLVCHDDVLVFRKPDLAATATARSAQRRARRRAA